MRFCERVTIAMNTNQWAFSDEILLAVVNTETNCCESMLITCFASCLEMWDVIWEMRFRFVFCWDCLWRFVLVIMLDHFIVILWRMFILDCRVTYICSRFVERRLWWDVIKLDERSHWMTKATHQTWWMKTSSHQIWRKRLIKSDERHLIKLWERKTIFLLSDKRSHASIHCMRNLAWQKITFCTKIDDCVKLLW